MILVDTTILVYAVGAHHPLREACRRVIAAIGDGRMAATTTIEAIQEFAHVRARRRGRRDARDLALSYIHLLSPLTQVDGEDLTPGSSSSPPTTTWVPSTPFSPPPFSDVTTSSASCPPIGASGPSKGSTT